MKKYILLSLISSISMSLNVSGDITIGTSAAYGLEGLSYPYTKLKPIMSIVLNRQNIFDEHGASPNLPDFSAVSKKSDENSSHSDNSEAPKRPSNYYPTFKEYQKAQIKLTADYFLRMTQFDTTLFDGHINFDDYGTTLGLVVKPRPHKYGQAWKIYDINRAYAYAKVDTKRLKLDSTFYFTGYEDGTPGLNKYSEGQNLEPKKHNSLDFDMTLTPLLTRVRPEFQVDYSSSNTAGAKLMPGLAIDVIKDNGSTVTAYVNGFVYDDKGRYNEQEHLENEIGNMAPGYDKKEYFKNWELGEPVLDKEYNKDRTIEGKDGKAAYRYIGKRDIEKGWLSGVNGSIRAVGSPTGALYGDTLIHTVTGIAYNNFRNNLSERAREGLDGIFDNNIAFVVGDAFKTLGEKFKGLITRNEEQKNIKTKTEQLFTEITEISKDPEKQKEIAAPTIDQLFRKIQIPKNKNLSDFNVTYLIPVELREYLYGTFLPIPYEDSKWNIEYRKKQIKEGKLKFVPPIFAPIPGKVDPNYVPKKYDEDTNKVAKIGTTAKYGEINVDPDAAAAIINGKLFKNIQKASWTVYDSGLYNWNNMNGWSRFKSIVDLIPKFASLKSDLVNILKYTNLSIEHPEELESFDIFSTIQLNESEHEAKEDEYANEVMKYMLTDKEKREREGNDPNSKEKTISENYNKVKGFNVGMRYTNDSIPITFTNNTRYEQFAKSKTTSIATDSYKLNDALSKYDSMRKYGKTITSPNEREDKNVIMDSYYGYIDIKTWGRLFHYDHLNDSNTKDKELLKQHPYSENTSETNSERESFVYNSSKLTYNNQKLLVNAGFDISKTNVDYYNKNVKNLKFSEHLYNNLDNWAVINDLNIHKQNIDLISETKVKYNKYTINPSFELSYKFTPRNKWEVTPYLGYFGEYGYFEYLYAGNRKYLGNDSYIENFKREYIKWSVPIAYRYPSMGKVPYNAELYDKPYEEVSVTVYKRDKNNMLIKRADAPKTGNEEFDNIPAGGSVDISKFSKYLFYKERGIDQVNPNDPKYKDDDDKTKYYHDAGFDKSNMTKYFETYKKKGESHWVKPINTIYFKLNVNYSPIKQLRLGYQFDMPLILKGKDFDAVMFKNGVTLSYVFDNR